MRKIKLLLVVVMMFALFGVTANASESDGVQITQLAEGEGGGGGGGGNAEDAWNETINFFIVWIGRVGGGVGLIGGVMFALSLKNKDADQKENGLTTMVAGFAVFGITLAVDMFGVLA